MALAFSSRREQFSHPARSDYQNDLSSCCQPPGRQLSPRQRQQETRQQASFPPPAGRAGTCHESQGCRWGALTPFIKQPGVPELIRVGGHPWYQERTHRSPQGRGAGGEGYSGMHQQVQQEVAQVQWGLHQVNCSKGRVHIMLTACPSQKLKNSAFVTELFSKMLSCGFNKTPTEK